MPDAKFVIQTDLDLAGFERGIRSLQKAIDTAQRQLETKGMGAKSFKLVSEEMGVVANNLQKLRTGAELSAEEIKNMNTALNTSTKRTFSLSGAIQDVGRRVFIWGSLSAAIFGAIGALKEGFDTTVAFNREMANLQKILGDFRDFDFLKKEVFRLSIEYAQDPQETVKLLKELAQAGLSASESLDATNAALLAMNVTGIDAHESMNALIGAARIFNVEFADAANLIDKVQAIEAATAIDPQDLIASITKIGPAFTSLGGNIDDLFASIAALGEAARVSGTEAANSMKRVLSRIISPEGVRALQEFGVRVYATADSFRDLRSILGDISSQWTTASQAQKANLAMTLAQVRQYPKLLALLENYERNLEALEISENAFGEATRANDIILASYRSQLDRSSAKLREFSQTFYEGGIVEGLVEMKGAFTSIVSLTTPFAGTLGKIAGVLGGTVALVTAAVFGWRAFVKIMDFAKKRLVGMTATLELVNAGLAKHAAALGASTAAMRLFYATTLIGAAFVGAQLVVQLLNTRKSLQEVEVEFKTTTRAIQTFKDELKKIEVGDIAADDVQKKYKVLKLTFDDMIRLLKEGSLSAENFNEKLNNVLEGRLDKVTQKQIVEITKALKEFDDYQKRVANEAIDETISQKLQGVSNQLLDLIKEDRTALIDVDIDAVGYQRKIDALVKGIAESTGSVVRDVTVRDNISTGLSNIKVRDFINGEEAEKAYKRASDALDSYIKSVQSLQKEFNQIESAKTLTQSMTAQDEYSRKQVEIQQQLSSSASVAARELTRLVDIQKLTRDVFFELDDATKEMYNIQSFDTFGQSLDSVRSKMVEMLAMDMAQALSPNSKEWEELSKILEGVITKLEKTGGILVGRFDTSQFMSALKQTDVALLSGLGAQISAVNKLRGELGELGKQYFSADYVSKQLGSTITALNTQFANNAKKIKDLEIVTKGLNLAQTFIAGLEGSSIFAQDIVDIDQKLHKNRTTLITLQEVQKGLEARYVDTVKTLEVLKSAYDSVTASQERQKTVLNGLFDAQKDLIGVQTELNSLRFGNDAVTLYQRNLEVSDKLLKNEIARTKSLEANATVTTEEAQAKNTVLRIQNNLNNLVSKQKFIISEIAEEYKKVDDVVGAVSKGVEDALSNQKEFFSLLSGDVSFLDYIGNAFSGVTEAILKNSAKTISDTFTKGLREGLAAQNDRLQNLVTAFDNIGKFNIESMVAGIKTAYDTSLEKSLTDITNKIVSAFDEASKIMQVAIQNILVALQSVDLEVKKTEEGVQANITVDTTSLEPVIEKQTKSITDTLGTFNQQFSTQPSKLFGADLLASSKFEQTFRNDETFKNSKRQFEELRKQNALSEEGTKKIVERLQDIPIDFSDKLEELNSNLGTHLRKEIEGLIKINEYLLENNKDNKALQKSQRETREASLQLLTTMAGQFLGTKIGDAQSAQTGTNLASLGITAYNAFAETAISTATSGLLLGAGGLLGGIFSSLFGKDDEEPKQTSVLERIESNTAKMVDKLTPEIINAPSNFNLPAVRGAGNSSVVIQNNFTVSAGNSGDIVRTLETQLTDMYNRTTRNRSPLG